MYDGGGYRRGVVFVNVARGGTGVGGSGGDQKVGSERGGREGRGHIPPDPTSFLCHLSNTRQEAASPAAGTCSTCSRHL